MPKLTKLVLLKDAELIEAMQYLETKGIPTNKHEDYKYCNLDAIFKKEFKSIKQEFNEIQR
ncbi:MAG: hypothetical protein IPG08_11115 [Sphingobacteriaceae bacterium]|nr:hypothetical protein [Sphingobacteriaceae bacterium]